MRHVDVRSYGRTPERIVRRCDSIRILATQLLDPPGVTVPPPTFSRQRLIFPGAERFTDRSSLPSTRPKYAPRTAFFPIFRPVP